MPQIRGLASARRMRKWADRKGGVAAAADGFDRSDAGTLANRGDQWLGWLEVRAFSPRKEPGFWWIVSPHFAGSCPIGSRRERKSPIISSRFSARPPSLGHG